MLDKHCKELQFPVLFPKGRYGYTTEREISISPTKYFNARLLHYSGGFATNPEYLFFVQFIIEQKKVSDSINIVVKKVHGQSLTASELRGNSQRLVNLSLYLSRSGILILVPNRRYCTVLAKINV